MKTDKHLYAIFAARPEWIFELANLDSPGACAMKAVTLKALAQESDGVIVPSDPAQKLTVVEFQFQEDATIYVRTAIEMALVQQEHQMREVQGVIFFRYPSLDPKTEPWCRIIHACTLRDVLEALAQREPDHPLVAVFRPVMLSNEAVLERNAREYYHQIRTSALDENVKQTLLNVFVDWLEQRLKDKNKKEIEQMLLGELPDLRETQSGKDLIRIGRDEGMKEGRREGKKEGKKEALKSLMEAKFGSLPPDILERIDRSDSLEKVQALLLQVLTARSLETMDW